MKDKYPLNRTMRLTLNALVRFTTVVLLLAVFQNDKLWGQNVSTYTFTQATGGTYTAISTSTNIIVNAATDDGVSALTNIGFTFYYHGTAFTQFCASSNGFISLGSTVSTSLYSPLSGTANCIAFAAKDGKTNTAVTYELSGTAPNRILTVQYPDYYLQYNNASNKINAQIKLYETSNIIRIIYGSSSRGNNYTPQVGLTGSSSSDYSVRTSTTGWNNTTTASSNTSTVTWSTSYYPANGQTYTWAPPPTLTATTLADFGSICINNTAGPNTFTITGSYLNAGTISVGPLTGYTFSSDNVSYSNSLALACSAGSYSKTIYVKFSPTTVQSYNGNIAVSGGGAAAINVAATGSGISTPAVANTPSPASGTTGVCFTGTGALTAVSWAAVSGATSYDVYFGAGSLPGSVTANVATNSYTTGALQASTTYYWKIVPKNNCGINNSGTTWNFSTGAAPCYCTSSGGVYTEGIMRVIFNTIDNNSNSNPAGYSNYTALSTTVYKGSSYPLSVYINTGGSYTHYQMAWIDWDMDGVFNTSTEQYNLGTAYNVTSGNSGSCPYSITVPAGAASGTTRMRISSKYNASPTSCETAFDGEVEDYTINIVAPPYQASYLSMNTGAFNWCAGETRQVTVTIKNTGTSSWTDYGTAPWGTSGEDFNIGVRWNEDADYFTRVDAQNLAPGATATYTISVTAPVTTGANNLTFNVVREGISWFGGPYTSSSVNIIGLPANVSAGADATICPGNSVNLSGTASSYAATSGTIGSTSTNGLYYPFNTYWHDSKCQFLILASELTAAGMSAGSLTSVAFNVNSLSPDVMNNFNISMVSTAATSLTDYLSGLTTVYSGTYTVPGSGWQAISFQTPYVWDGTSNLVVQICFDNTSYNARSEVTYATVSANRLAYNCVDGGTGCSLTGPTFDTKIPNVKFGFTPAISYSWSPATGLSSAVISNPAATPPATTTYTLSAGINGCSATDAALVTVNALSVAPTSVPFSSICAGGSATLGTSGGSSGTGSEDVWYAGSCSSEAFTQEWMSQPYSSGGTTVNSVNNGILNITSTNADPMIFMPSLGSFDPNTYRYVNLRYRITGGTGGSWEIFFYNTNHNFAVGGEEVAGSLISDGNWHVTSLDMWADADYKTGGNITGWRFDWAGNSGVTMEVDYLTLASNAIIGEGTTLTVSPVTNTTYYTSKKGECNTTSCASGTVTVFPVISITTQPTGGTLCTGGSLSLSVTATGGVSLNYQWYKDGSPVAGAAGSSYAATESGNYYCQVSSAGSGCNAVNSTTVTVTVNQDPSITAQPVSGTICTGATYTLSVSTANGVSLGYQWYKDGSPVPGATASSYGATLAGSYYCQISSTGSGCDNISSQTAAVSVLTSGSWIGSVGSDWFTPGNWCLSGNIPSATTDITIPDASLTSNDPAINSAGALCRNLTLSSGSAISMGTNGVLSVYGNWGNNGGYFNPGSGKVVFDGSNSQVITGTSTSQSFHDLEMAMDNSYTLTLTGSTNTLNITGDLKLTSGTLMLDADETLNLSGNWTDNASGNFVAATGATVIFNGSTEQTINGSNSPVFSNLTINNTSTSGVTLAKTIHIEGILRFIDGILHSSNSDYLVFNDNGNTTGANNNSHVDGYIVKFTNSTTYFCFPSGDGTKYRGICVTPDNNIDTKWTVHYYSNGHANSDPAVFTSDGSLSEVSRVEYWDLKRTGNATAKITLTWDSQSQVADTQSIVVAHLNGSTWESCGATQKLGDPTAGSVASISGWDDYSPFTLGKQGNPLPVNLLGFSASCGNDGVEVTWSTSTEVNNDHYTIERSDDAKHWETVGTKAGAGNSNTPLYYTFTDPETSEQVRYYRLRQTDYDGKTEAFAPVAVTCGATPVVVAVYPNPFHQELFFESKDFAGSELRINVRDLSGRLLMERSFPGDQVKYSIVKLDLSALSKGVYMVEMKSGKNSMIQKVIKE